MSRNDRKPEQLEQWTSTIAAKFPNLSKPQATVLALWSFGMALAKSCGITSVVAILAPLLSIGKDKKSIQRKKNSLRQRLRQWCYDAKDKNGNKRRELGVQTCFPFLMKWIISQWQGKQIALALDATALSVRFTVLVVSVLYRGCAIPVAWTVLKGNTKGAWNREWLRMLRLLRPGIPGYMTVIVLTDRGLYSTRLFRRICRLGWHPFMRRSVLGMFRPACGHYFRDISSFAKKPGTLRMTSVFQQSWIAIFVSLVHHFPLPLGRFIPEPWLQIPETSHQPEPNTGLAKCA